MLLSSLLAEKLAVVWRSAASVSLVEPLDMSCSVQDPQPVLPIHKMFHVFWGTVIPQGS